MQVWGGEKRELIKGRKEGGGGIRTPDRSSGSYSPTMPDGNQKNQKKKTTPPKKGK